MSTALESLRDVVQEGIREELFNIYQSRALFSEIARHAKALNGLGLGGLFRFIQDRCVDALTLSLTKIFDKTSNRNRPRSVDEALRLLENRTHEFELRDRSYALKTLNRHGISLVQTQTDQEIIIEMCKCIRTQVSAAEPTLLALKDQRDKRIAHRESKIEISDLKLPTWREVDHLVQVAINFLDLVGYPLLGSTCIISGKFVLARDAEDIRGELQDLMKRIGVSPGAVN